MGGGLSLEEKQVKNKKEKKIEDTVGFRIMGFFFVISLFVTVIFEIFYLQSIHKYYYDNIASVLFTQARYNSELYFTYFSESDLMQVVAENKDQFYRSNAGQVQILNNSGVVLYDNLGTDLAGDLLTSNDVIAALDNRTEVYVGQASYDTNNVMSLTYPLNNQSQQVGFIRLTTSLKNIDGIILNRAITSLLFSVIAIGLAVLVSYFVSRSIINPLTGLTEVANKLADGQFDEQADESYFGELGELSETLNIMSDNIQKKEQLKNEFISSVSHELRTPLTSIKGWAITLQSEGIDEEINNEGLKIIEKEADRLSTMVEDLLDFSKFTAGRVTLTKTTFDLVQVTNNIITQLSPRTKEKNIDMVFNYNDEVIEIVADEDKIKQLLLNVLDNAYKFTPEGGTIITDLQKKDEQVQISITDTGIGISPEEIDLVTEKFWKGSTSASHSGLGLSICEEIAKAHGGTLSIKSKVDVGTTVTTILPTDKA